MTETGDEPYEALYKSEIFVPAKDYLTLLHSDRESIIRHCRDINAYSKKMIFILHTISDKQVGKRTYMNMLENVKMISRSLAAIYHQHSHKLYFYQFKSTISNSVEEMIEAFTFAYYVMNDDMLPYEEFLYIVRVLILGFNVDSDNFKVNAIHFALDRLLFNSVENVIIDHEQRQMNVDNPTFEISFLVPGDYMMGLFDLTGEIMRSSISGLNDSKGGIERASKNLQFMRNLQQKLLLIHMKYPRMSLVNGIVNLDSDHKGNDAIKKKMFVMKQSIEKVQSSVCDIYIGKNEHQWDFDNTA